MPPPLLGEVSASRDDPFSAKQGQTDRSNNFSPLSEQEDGSLEHLCPKGSGIRNTIGYSILTDELIKQSMRARRATPGDEATGSETAVCNDTPAGGGSGTHYCTDTEALPLPRRCR